MQPTHTAFVVFALCTLADAHRSLRRRELAADQKLAGEKVVALKDEMHQMQADVRDAQSQIQMALVQLETLAELQTPKTNSSEKVHVALKAKPSKEDKKPPAKEPSQKKVVAKKATNKTAQLMAMANAKAIIAKQQTSLEKLFKHLKSSIAKFNKHEVEAKHVSQKQVLHFQERVAADKKALQKKDLSAWEHSLLVNRTKMDEEELKYSEHDRSLDHDVYHANLKMTHGLMSGVSDMINAFKTAAQTGKVDQKLLAKVRNQVGAKALIQTQDHMQRATELYLTNLKKKMSE